MMSETCPEPALGLEPSAALEEELPEAEQGAYFPCQKCDGHGALVVLKNERREAVLCDRCDGTGTLWASNEDIFEAEAIGSNNPTCVHDFVCTGTAYGGDDDRFLGEGRSYCTLCGADGDA